MTAARRQKRAPAESEHVKSQRAGFSLLFCVCVDFPYNHFPPLSAVVNVKPNSSLTFSRTNREISSCSTLGFFIFFFKLFPS